MLLSTSQLLTLLQLKGLGRVTAFSLGNYVFDNNIKINNLSDMLDLIKLCRDKKIAKRLNDYSILDLEKGQDMANNIIELSNKQEVELISFYDIGYPQQLKTLLKNGKNASPLILHCKGDTSILKTKPGIAIIGTREPTLEGVLAGEMLGEEFAKREFNIISGLAIGCDTCAHKGALKSENGVTTAFLAHGLDTVYPKENSKLADEIIERRGLLISEYSIGTSLRPEFLVERDRLQSGLANGTIVIQTGIIGGTMHAVNTTLENEKPLFAVQYKDSKLLTQEKVKGNTSLIKENKATPLRFGDLDNIASLLKTSPQTSKALQEIDLFTTNNVKYKGVIFDLDLTLIDTTSLEKLRSERKWKEINNAIKLDSCHLYDGLKDVFQYLQKENIKICIVTSSPKSYASNLVKHFNIPCDLIVGYHDAKPKPSEEPMIKALTLLGENSNNVISFGDRIIDIESSNKASIKSVGCLWGSNEKEALKAYNCSKLISRPKDIINVLQNTI